MHGVHARSPHIWTPRSGSLDPDSQIDLLRAPLFPLLATSSCQAGEVLGPPLPSLPPPTPTPGHLLPACREAGEVLGPGGVVRLPNGHQTRQSQAGALRHHMPGQGRHILGVHPVLALLTRGVHLNMQQVAGDLSNQPQLCQVFPGISEISTITASGSSLPTY